MRPTAPTTWPRRRLQLRSIISATMSIGWIWVAATALIPYFVIGRGRGSGSIEMFGVARTEWLSFHVWSSIAIGLLTVGHVLLNRRGLTRSYRVVAGAPTRSGAIPGGAGAGKRGLSWLAALTVLVVAVGGSWAYAAASGEPVGDGRGGSEAVQDIDADRSAAAENQPRSPGSGNGYRGGRGTGNG